MVRLPVLIAASLVASACSVASHPPQTPLWDLAGRKVHVVVTATPPGDVDRDGGDSFYHEIVTDQRDKAMILLVGSVAPQIADLADSFALKLRERGLNAAVSDSFILPEPPDLEGKTLFEAIRLARGSLMMPRASSEIEEFVLLLAIPAWGVRRDFAGIIPVGRHAAHFELEATLLDPRNPFVPLWSTLAAGTRSIAPRWNEPPDFPKVIEALALALDDGIQELTQAFFAWNGIPDAPNPTRARASGH